MILIAGYMCLFAVHVTVSARSYLVFCAKRPVRTTQIYFKHVKYLLESAHPTLSGRKKKRTFGNSYRGADSLWVGGTAAGEIWPRKIKRCGNLR